MKRLILLLHILFLFSCAWAQQSKDIRKMALVEGEVKDNALHTPILGVLVEQLSADSALIQSAKTKGKKYNNGTDNMAKSAKYHFILERGKKYILRFSHEDYNTAYLDIDLTDLRKRELDKEIPTAFLVRMMTQQLDEVVVKATKLLFYNKGDTIVYDASAFHLQEGSMLDALVQQMPNTRLNDNGEIFVNGKKVNELLLNGKKFFKGNNRILLDNLPNYMVSTVNVYDRQSEQSEFLGYDTGDERYVMDVKLKKQYSVGWMGNIEGGGGTEERYQGRLFLTRFTNNSQVSLYGNVNNVNENRKPGQNGNWSPDKVGGGELATHMAGVNYAIDDRYDRFKLNGNAQFTHTDNDLDSYTDRMNFLQAGNTYDRIQNLSRNKNLSFTTDHHFYMKRPHADFSLDPKFSYNKYDRASNYSSATADSELSGLGKELADQLFAPDAGETLRRVLINRNMQESLGNGSKWNGTLKAGSNIKMKYSPDALNLSASASFQGGTEEQYAQNRVDYYQGTVAHSSDFRNQYRDNQPERGYDYKLKASYIYKNWTWPTWTFFYQYGQKYTSSRSSLYRLDQLEGWNIDAEHEIGTLPSEQDYLGTMDVMNSYDSRQWNRTHEAGIHLNWNKKTSKGKWWAQVRPTLTMLNSKLIHLQAKKDTAFTRRTTLVNMGSTFLNWEAPNKKNSITLYYDIHSKAPEMTYFVNVRNDADPLNVTVGNKNLKDSYQHSYRGSYTFTNKGKQRSAYLLLGYNRIRNAIAMGYTYDRKTGVRTFRPENVNGNWDANADVSFFMPLDKQRKVELSNLISGNYIHSVDLVETTDAPTDRKSIVNTFRLTEKLGIKYRTEKFTVGFNANVAWDNSQSDRETFATINAVDLHYGATLQWKLPYKWQFDTDLTMYTRRGYSESTMNTDNLVWNARISRPVFKNRLLLSADGFDILQQLSNVTRTLNAQARVETYTNVVPRYFMVHLTYRLNIRPKATR